MNKKRKAGRGCYQSLPMPSKVPPVPTSLPPKPKHGLCPFCVGHGWDFTTQACVLCGEAADDLTT